MKNSLWKRLTERIGGAPRRYQAVIPDGLDPDTLVEVCGSKRITISELQELKHHQQVGAYYREQMEAARERCCEILGVDPAMSSIQRDYAFGIVNVGSPPEFAIDAINQFQRDLMG